MTAILGKKYLTCGLIVFVYYAVQFVMCVSACNHYSDVSRKNICEVGGELVLTETDASEVLDGPIYTTGIFHIMEWIRTTMLLSVIMIGAPILIAWYITGIITFIYAVVVFIYTLSVYAGDRGKACGDAQETRYQWLMW